MKRRAYPISELVGIKSNTTLPIGESHVALLYELSLLLEVSIEMGMLIDSKVFVLLLLWKKKKGEWSINDAITEGRQLKKP